MLKKLQQKGLKHRFDPEDKEIWYFWHRCLWCGKNSWDCLHHIISPSSHGYREVEENRSILNSSPMHNHGCHLDNPELHNREMEIKLLEKTLISLSIQGYDLKDIDRLFIKTYYDTHFNSIKLPSKFCG